MRSFCTPSKLSTQFTYPLSVVSVILIRERTNVRLWGERWRIEKYLNTSLQCLRPFRRMIATLPGAMPWPAISGLPYVDVNYPRQSGDYSYYCQDCSS